MAGGLLPVWRKAVCGTAARCNLWVCAVREAYTPSLRRFLLVPALCVFIPKADSATGLR